MTTQIVKSPQLDADDLLRRAIKTYLRDEGAQQPAAQHSGLERHDGLRYVVLRNVNGVLAVYRVRGDIATLKRLKRWPKGAE